MGKPSANSNKQQQKPASAASTLASSGQSNKYTPANSNNQQQKPASSASTLSSGQSNKYSEQQKAYQQMFLKRAQKGSRKPNFVSKIANTGMDKSTDDQEILKRAQKRSRRPIFLESKIANTGMDKSTDQCDVPPIVGQKLQDLCKQIDPSFTLDSVAQERLVELADSFVDKVTKDAIKLAKHRGSKTLDAADVALALKKGQSITVPGLGPQMEVRGKGEGVMMGTMGGWLSGNTIDSKDAQPPTKKIRSGSSSTTAAEQ